MCSNRNLARGLYRYIRMGHGQSSTTADDQPEESPCFENVQDEVDITKLPIPHHWPQDRGRYVSASVIIAEDNGVRNMSFHRQFVRDKNHLVVRLVPRHLRTMVMAARERGRKVKIAIVNAPDPVVLLAAAMSFDDNVDELTIAATLHQKLYGTPLNLTTMPNGIVAPANSEYVMWSQNNFGRLMMKDHMSILLEQLTDVRQEPSDRN